MKFDRDYLHSLLQSPLCFNGSVLKDYPPLDVHLFDTVASTNTAVWRLLDEGTEAGTVAIALQQLAGRGQWGRQWCSPVGGLYLSIALEPDLAIEHSAHLTLATVWGIATALRDRALPVQIKWLNDLVVDGYKLGGILTETRLQQGRITQAVIGVGINWRNPVPATGINLEMVQAQHTRTIDSLESLAAIVLLGCLGGYTHWQHQGVCSLVTSYQTLMTDLGRAIQVEGTTGEILGIASTGELHVRLAANATDQRDRYLPPGSIGLGYPTQPWQEQRNAQS